MTDQNHEVKLSAALSRLRTDVRGTVAPPAAAQLRHQADRRLRTRRTAVTLVAAATVGAVLIGGGVFWNGAARTVPPVPGGSPSVPQHGTPSGAPSSTPSGTPSGTPSIEARPSRPVAARQPPQVPAAWKGVDWTSVTITFPVQRGCPSGPVALRKQPVGDYTYVVGPASYPRVSIGADAVAYGDLTGDGQPEAILGAACKSMEEDSGDGEGQILMVRRDGNALRATWVGPRGGVYSGHWVAAGRLYLDVKPHYGDWDYRLGAARAYRWTGQAFTEQDSGYPGVVPTGGGTGPAIDLGPLAGLTGCPATTLRFGSDGRTTAAGTTWHLQQPQAPDDLPHLVDLDGDGRRRLLITITCDRDSFMAVLDRGADGSYRALDALRAPEGKQMTGWQYTNGTLTVWVAPRNGGETSEVRYTWNGEYFQQ